MIGKLFGNLPGRGAAAAQDAPEPAPPDAALQLLTEIKAHLFNQGTLHANLLMANLLANPAFGEPGRLERYGWKGYSQNDEDGILAEIFRRIGTRHRTFVEFGCGTGIENNSTYLLSQGWRGLWMDGSETNANCVTAAYSYLIEHQLLHFRQAMVTADNIDSLIASAGLGPEIDLLSIDIDGNDARIWQEIRSAKARVVVIEYNAKFRPPHDYSMTYSPEHQWDATDRMGSSLATYTTLGESLGYQLVACNITGANAFFVRRDLAGDRFATPATAEHLYQPPRYFLTPYFSSGHRGNSVTVVESAALSAGLPWPPTEPLTRVLGMPAP